MVNVIVVKHQKGSGSLGFDVQSLNIVLGAVLNGDEDTLSYMKTGLECALKTRAALSQ